jgi:hypothetical protein
VIQVETKMHFGLVGAATVLRPVHG